MQQPPQPPVYVPYFNHPRMYQQAQQPQPQQPQAYYPAAPLQYQAQPAPMYPQVEQAQQDVPLQAFPVQQAQPQIHNLHNIPSVPGHGINWQQCCKRFDAKKCLKLATITTAILHGLNYLSILFRTIYMYRVSSSYLLLVTMATVAAILAFTALRKKNVVLLGVFIGISLFSTLAAVEPFFVLVFLIASSFTNFFAACAEIIIAVSKIASIVIAAKLISSIKNEMDLPQFVAQEQQQQQEQQEQQQEQEIQKQIYLAQLAQVEQQQPLTAVQPIYSSYQSITQPQVAQVPLVQQPLVQQPIIQQPVVQKPFATELGLLRDMGFTDTDKSLALLQKHNGNLQSVVQEYIHN